MPQNRQTDRAETNRTIRNIDSRVWSLLSVGLVCLAVVVFGFLLLRGPGHAPQMAEQGGPASKSSPTVSTPAPNSIPKNSP